MNKDAILRIRLPSRAKALIREAAERHGMSMSDFVLQAALKQADPPLLRVVQDGPHGNAHGVPEHVPGQLTLTGGLTLNERK